MTSEDNTKTLLCFLARSSEATQGIHAASEEAAKAQHASCGHVRADRTGEAAREKNKKQRTRPKRFSLLWLCRMRKWGSLSGQKKKTMSRI